MKLSSRPYIFLFSGPRKTAGECGSRRSADRGKYINICIYLYTYKYIDIYLYINIHIDTYI